MERRPRSWSAQRRADLGDPLQRRATRRRSGRGSTRPGPASRVSVASARSRTSAGSCAGQNPARGSSSTNSAAACRVGQRQRERDPVVTEHREVGGREQPPGPVQRRPVGASCGARRPGPTLSRSSSTDRRTADGTSRTRVPPGRSTRRSSANSPSRSGSRGSARSRAIPSTALVRTGSAVGRGPEPGGVRWAGVDVDAQPPPGRQLARPEPRRHSTHRAPDRPPAADPPTQVSGLSAGPVGGPAEQRSVVEHRGSLAAFGSRFSERSAPEVLAWVYGAGNGRDHLPDEQPRRVGPGRAGRPGNGDRGAGRGRPDRDVRGPTRRRRSVCPIPVW